MTFVEALPIACTLAPGEFKGRVASIAALNKDALQKYERRDLVLELSYASKARGACARNDPQRSNVLRIPFL